ncbi:hypothetical protein [Streptomyces similanensis]|uniref:Uncharacterized protein n=1 Tax=Streptomyces similanensis TaxID=1274988 RepID=A0ABP9KGA1_9ACTN
MAATPFPTLRLPVRLTIGGHSADVGTITVNGREQVGPQIADALRAAADAYDRVTDEEVSTDAAPR